MAYKTHCLVCDQYDDDCDCKLVRRDRWDAAKSAWLTLRALVASADLDLMFYVGVTCEPDNCGVRGGDTGSEPIS